MSAPAPVGPTSQPPPPAANAYYPPAPPPPPSMGSERPAAPPPWGYAPAGPPPARPRSTRTLAIVIIVVAVALFFLLPSLVGLFLFTRPPIGPGATPLGVVVSMNGSRATCGGSPASPSGCSYRFAIALPGEADGAGPVPPASVLSFALLNASGSPVAGQIQTITLVSSTNCSVSVWSPSTGAGSAGAWSVPPSSAACPSASATSPLATGESLLVVPVAATVLSTSGSGLALEMFATPGPIWSGSISASFPK